MQILDMSRLQAGLGITVNPVPTDLSALVSDIVAESDMAFRNQAIEANVQADVHANIDPDRYAQLIANLLSNARHHGTPGYPIKLELRAEAGQIELNIRNHAEPMSTASLDGLFTPFKQSSGSDRNRGGLGIGLYICQAIAVAHGGTLTATQSKDGEITFTQRLQAN